MEVQEGAGEAEVQTWKCCVLAVTDHVDEVREEEQEEQGA